MKQSTVWFVTGASKGLGLSIVKQLLAKGFQVAATSRSKEDLQKAVGDSEGLLPPQVQLNNEASVASAIEETVKTFGKIDVVINNAGYGLTGSLEELTDAEARNNFEINVFGSLNVIRKALPYLRKQRSGHIINISSIGGFNGNFPGFGIYCATKFAVEGFTESLAAEAKSLGIQATIVSPGYFRTNFLNPDSLHIPQNEIAEYKEVREVVAAHQHNINGNQAGDPEKAAAAIIDVANKPNAPLHLFLGEDAYNLAYAKINAVKEDLEAWKAVSVSTAIEA